MLDGLLGTVTKHGPDAWDDGHHYRVEFEVCPCGLATPDDPCYEWYQVPWGARPFKVRAWVSPALPGQ